MKGILVNIFGGIMKCDVIANGVIAAVKAVGLQVPLVVRLEGTNVEKGKEIIRSSGLNVIPADDLDDAAQKIVAAVRKGLRTRSAPYRKRDEGSGGTKAMSKLTITLESHVMALLQNLADERNASVQDIAAEVIESALEASARRRVSASSPSSTPLKAM